MAGCMERGEDEECLSKRGPSCSDSVYPEVSQRLTGREGRREGGGRKGEKRVTAASMLTNTQAQLLKE